MGHSPALEGTPQPGAGTVSSEAVSRVGRRVGDYALESVIGEGGTGVVYRGHHVANDEPVAIKILHDRGARQKDVVEQFIAEARATSRIRHPNVIDVLDLGIAPDGTVFLVMEYLQGESLHSRLLAVTRLPLFEAINILRQVARGLGAAHEAGIVHGGLKPADIFLCRRKGRRRIVHRSKAQGMRLVVEPEETFDLVKLLDFGMARFLDRAPGAQARAGAVHGTLYYLSPEQAQEQPADRQSDIYSLGAVFYEMITGAVPFAGESLLEILRGHVSGQVIAPSRRTPRAGIDGRIDALILKCLKKNPLLRFASTDELCDALDACTTDCVFLRDAHRLPGIRESGIDLSEAVPDARRDGAQAVEKPAVAQKIEDVPVVDESATTSEAQAPAPMVDDPRAAGATPAPTVGATTDDFAAAVKTPAPTVAAADVPAESSAEVAHRPRLRIVERPEAIVPDMDKLPARFNPGEDVLPISRRPQVIALAGVLLFVGVGIAVWVVRGEPARSTARTIAIAQPIVPPTPAPSPPPAAVPTVEPVAALSAAAPTAAPPGPELAAPAAEAAARDPGKLALARTRASPARRTTSAIARQPEKAPVSAGERAPASTPLAPATADDLVREAQRAWMAGQYAAAIGKAQSALKTEPNPTQAMQAYEIIATSSCAIGLTDVAREAFSHLSASGRELVRTMCAKRGVTIE